MYLKKGDNVQVISGKYKGKQGQVLSILKSKNRVVVEGVAMVKKHVKPNQQNQQGGIIEQESSVDVSNVALVDPSDNKPTRIGYKFQDGKKIRYSKRTGTEFTN